MMKLSRSNVGLKTTLCVGNAHVYNKCVNVRIFVYAAVNMQLRAISPHVSPSTPLHYVPF